MVSCQKSLFSIGFEDIPNFSAPAPSRGKPPRAPLEDIQTQKFGFVLLFSCLSVQRESNMHQFEGHHFVSRFTPLFPGGGSLGNLSETPTPTTCLKKVRQYTSNLYGSTPPICIAILSWLLSFEGRETLQYASHLYCSTPPICTAVRPPFVRQYFWKNTGGWGHRNVSENCGFMLEILWKQ